MLFSLLDVHIWYIYLCHRIIYTFPISHMVKRLGKWNYGFLSLLNCNPFLFIIISSAIPTRTFTWEAVCMKFRSIYIILPGFSSAYWDTICTADDVMQDLSVYPMFLALGLHSHDTGFHHYMTALPQCHASMVNLRTVLPTVLLVWITGIIPFFLLMKVKSTFRTDQRMLANDNHVVSAYILWYIIFGSRYNGLMRNINCPVRFTNSAYPVVAFGVSLLPGIFIRKINAQNAKYIVG